MSERGYRDRPSSSIDPADRVTLDDEVRLALLVVLDRLTPAERVVFVLHDVFQLPYNAVAATVIGGTSLFGGQGGIAGTIIGALLMYTIRNWCALKSYPPEYERVIVGSVVILAVLYDRWGPGKRQAAQH